jgi:hypothetical protein
MRWLKWIVLTCVIGFISTVLFGNMGVPPKAPKDAPAIEHFDRTFFGGKPICPYCRRTDRIYLYEYGLTKQSAPQGMISGGCVLGPDSPKYKCSACGISFGRLANP